MSSTKAINEHVLIQGQACAHRVPNARKPPSFTLTFDSPSAGFSGLRVDSLKVLNETYNVYKGVKMVGRGQIEVRT